MRKPAGANHWGMSEGLSGFPITETFTCIYTDWEPSYSFYPNSYVIGPLQIWQHHIVAKAENSNEPGNKATVRIWRDVCLIYLVWYKLLCWAASIISSTEVSSSGILP